MEDRNRIRDRRSSLGDRNRIRHRRSCLGDRNRIRDRRSSLKDRKRKEKEALVFGTGIGYKTEDLVLETGMR